MEEAYHYPADLMSLLIETIPRLCRSKRDVLLYFRGCGAPEALLSDLAAQLRTNPQSVGKFDEVRTVLTRLNDGGDRYLRQRREVIKRIVETEDFSVCWEKDRLEAQGLVAQVRTRVQKSDAFTRMNLEREREAAEVRRRKEEDLKRADRRRTELDRLRHELARLFSQTDPHARGKALETILNQYFNAEDVLVREAFTFREAETGGVLEQIDGVIELDSHLYFVEVKWWNHRLAPADVALHMVRVAQRGEVRGLVISASGYTEAAITTVRNELQRRVFVLCELRELVLWIERDHRLSLALREKINRAMMDKNPLHPTT